MTAETEQPEADRPPPPFRVVTRADYTETDGTPRGGPRRMHLFRRPDGGEDQCGGKLYCRECIRESAR